jgi:hypothetical protein
MTHSITVGSKNHSFYFYWSENDPSIYWQLRPWHIASLHVNIAVHHITGECSIIYLIIYPLKYWGMT